MGWGCWVLQTGSNVSMFRKSQVNICGKFSPDDNTPVTDQITQSYHILHPSWVSISIIVVLR